MSYIEIDQVIDVTYYQLPTSSILTPIFIKANPHSIPHRNTLPNL
jgi:hypothetical protein